MSTTATTRTPLPTLFEAYPFMAETIRRSVRLHGFAGYAPIAINGEWEMRAVEKAAMRDAMRQEGICDVAREKLTDYGMSIAARLLS